MIVSAFGTGCFTMVKLTYFKQSLLFEAQITLGHIHVTQERLSWL